MYGPIVSRVPDAELEAKLVYTRTTNALILITGDTCLSFVQVRNDYNTVVIISWVMVVVFVLNADYSKFIVRNYDGTIMSR